MPKTAVDEDSPLMAAICNVGTAWKVGRTDSIARAKRTDYPADRLLREGIAPSNAPHPIGYRREGPHLSSKSRFCWEACAWRACGEPEQPAAQLPSSALGLAPALPSRTAGKTSENWAGHLLPCREFTPGLGAIGSVRPRLPRFRRRSTKRFAGVERRSRLDILADFAPDRIDVDVWNLLDANLFGLAIQQPHNEPRRQPKAKESARSDLAASSFGRDHPFGRPRMRSPIMFFWTCDVPPAIVIDSTCSIRFIQSPSGANVECRSR